MAWYSKIFSAIGVDLVSSVGKVIDDLVTTDEEMELTEIQKIKIQTAYKKEMQALLNKYDRQQQEHEENLEHELTNRLKLDMKSDSWLSKNVRPLALIFMTLVVSIMAFFTIFDNQLTDNQLESLKEWIPFFSALMMVIYGFYFGSRGIEKIQKIRSAGAADVEKVRKQLTEAKG